MIYLDHNSTTPTDPLVLDAKGPYFTETCANPASTQHRAGRVAAEAVAAAAHQVACLIKADDARQIVWTSGATESNNLALRGAAAWCRKHTGRDHLITATTEHKSVLDVVAALEEEGFSVTRVDPKPDGRIDPDDVAAAMTDRTAMVSIMWANNETGLINPISPIGSLCRSRGAIFHTDATQAVGKVPVNVESNQVHLLSCSAHKFYGPKGVGALFVRRRDPRVRLVPQILGGGHQRNMRSGTLNVPGIVGMGSAAELCRRNMLEEALRLGKLRDRLEKGLCERAGAVANAASEPRLPHTTNLSFEGLGAGRLMTAVAEVSCSHGSACTTTSLEAGYVLRRMGLSEGRVDSALRFGLGRWTDQRQIDQTIDLFAEACEALRHSPSAAAGRCEIQDPTA